MGLRGSGQLEGPVHNEGRPLVLDEMQGDFFAKVQEGFPVRIAMCRNCFLPGSCLLPIDPICFDYDKPTDIGFRHPGGRPDGQRSVGFDDQGKGPAVAAHEFINLDHKGQLYHV